MKLTRCKSSFTQQRIGRESSPMAPSCKTFSECHWHEGSRIGMCHLLHLSSFHPDMRILRTWVSSFSFFSRNLMIFLLNVSIQGCPRDTDETPGHTSWSFKTQNDWWDTIKLAHLCQAAAQRWAILGMMGAISDSPKPAPRSGQGQL